MITNGQEVSAYGHGGQGDDSKNIFIKMTTGSSNVFANQMESLSSEVTSSS